MIFLRVIIILFIFIFSKAFAIENVKNNINAAEKTASKIKSQYPTSPLSNIAIPPNKYNTLARFQYDIPFPNKVLPTNRHSLSIDFGPTLFSIGYFNIANLFVNQPDGIPKRMFSGTFGIGFNYSYLIKDRIQLDTHIGLNTVLFYYYNDYVLTTPNPDFGVHGPGEVGKYFLSRVIDIPIYGSARFYLGKKTNSGFFLAPKIGGNLVISFDKVETSRLSVPDGTGGTEFLYQVATNAVVFKAGLFLSLEVGMRIDLNIQSLSRRNIKSFLDLSFIDVGYYLIPYYSRDLLFGEARVALEAISSYVSLLNIRLVPFPKIAFGVSF